MVIADDVASLRYLARASLSGDPEMVVVGEAGNGREAIERVVELRPDVLLLDLSMPEMDGLEALPKVRAASPGTAVVVFSGFAASGMTQLALELGAAAYIEKGVSPEVLVETVRAARCLALA